MTGGRGKGKDGKGGKGKGKDAKGAGRSWFSYFGVLEFRTCGFTCSRVCLGFSAVLSFVSYEFRDSGFAMFPSQYRSLHSQQCGSCIVTNLTEDANQSLATLPTSTSSSRPFQQVGPTRFRSTMQRECL